jgi:hypothetical protein
VLNVYDEYGEDLRLIMDYDRLVEGLTSGAIGEAAARYFDFDNYIEVQLVPRTGAEPEAVSGLP